MFKSLQYIAIAGIICISAIANAQIKVIHVDGKKGATNKEGIFYSLPQTHLKVEVVVERKEHVAGPLAAYAEKYLGVNGIQTTDQLYYEIKDVRLSSYIQPDPDQLFYVQVDKRSKESKDLALSLNESGILLGVNVPVAEDKTFVDKVNLNVKTEPDKDYFSYFSDYNFYKKVDTIIRKISVDTFSIEKYNYNTRFLEKNPEMKAKEIAEKIEKLRKDRYLLLIGFQEINYGESIQYMGEELRKMESAYLSLFTGYTKTEFIYKSFTFLPSVDNINKGIPIFKFSKTQGIGTNGSRVNLMIKSDQLSKKISKFLSTAPFTDPSTRTGFYYRVPEYADVQLIYNGEVLDEKPFIFGQFGEIAQTSSLDAVIEFYPATGGIKQLKIKEEGK